MHVCDIRQKVFCTILPKFTLASNFVLYGIINAWVSD